MQQSPKKNEVVDLTTPPRLPTTSPLDLASADTSPIVAKAQQEPGSTGQLHPLTSMLCCKGIVYSRLPYETLWEGTPLIDEESDGTICTNADWVTVGDLLTGLLSGTIREKGKEAKLLQQVPNLEREYAMDTLTNLAVQWVTHGTDTQRTPRVLLRRIPDNTWCFPGGQYILDDVGDNTRIPTPSCF